MQINCNIKRSLILYCLMIICFFLSFKPGLITRASSLLNGRRILFAKWRSKVEPASEM